MTASPVVHIAPSILRAAAQRAQLRVIFHVRDARYCACATGGACRRFEDLDTEADRAWGRVAAEEARW